MKIAFKDIENFVKRPHPQAMVILVYGPDDGLVRERAKTMAKTIVDDLQDPFLVASLTKDEFSQDPSRFMDEAHAIPMLGGRDDGGKSRLIRLKDGADAMTATLKDYLEKPNPEALILIEASDLGPRSTLRKLCETAPNAAALPCYVDDDRTVRQVVQDTLRHAGYLIDRDALEFLCQAISGDRMKIRGDLDKLITYMGPAPEYKGYDGPAISYQLGTVGLDEAQAICGDTGAQGTEDLVMAAGHKRGVSATKILNRLLDEGTSIVWILRALQTHFRRLHEAKTKTTQHNMTAQQAIESLRPPVFFKQKPDFQKQLTSYSQEELEQILLRLTALEIDAKSSGSQTETLLAQYFVELIAA